MNSDGMHCDIFSFENGSMGLEIMYFHSHIFTIYILRVHQERKRVKE